MSQWFRMYGEVINDPKVMRLPEASRWHWVAVLCTASMNDGKVPAAADLAFLLRMPVQRAAAIVTELCAAGLLDKVDGGFVPHNWDGRQYKSDVSTERVKRFRNKHRNVSSDVSETPPEQKQNRAEAEQSARAVVSGSEKALRSDLTEVFGAAKCPADLSRAGVWLSKGYSPSMVVEVVRELLARKPDVASLAYFDSALAERHGKRGMMPTERAAAATSIDLDKVVSMFARTGLWSKYAGPEPGQIGCRVSAEMLERHGLATDGQKIRKVG